MATQDLMLCIDIGSSSIKAAEFSYTPEGEMRMERFAFEEYAIPETSLQEVVEGDTHVEMLEALSHILKNNEFQSKKVSISLSGHDAYIRFVKVPSMVNDEKKIRQIIEFEARSAIPYEMNEVVWDSQLLSVADDSGEIEAMFVIVKSNEIESVTEV
ncbi:MAG: pilus assembly protein PilM, partial [Lentisphaeria bacterium]|nr:pilus assembly protein PilM [Lentisphaeria bacterium]